MEWREIEIDRCPECAGTWFDRDELALLFTDESANTIDEMAMNEVLALPAAVVDEPPKRCPLCRRNMRKVNIGPSRRVLVDVCEHGDGIWFDDREVEDLVADLPATFHELSARILDFLGHNRRGGVGRRSEGDDS
jgi:Zn-finger nucleic acid-binding protein